MAAVVILFLSTVTLTPPDGQIGHHIPTDRFLYETGLVRPLNDGSFEFRRPFLTRLEKHDEKRKCGTCRGQGSERRRQTTTRWPSLPE